MLKNVERQIMISILSTLVYNNFNDLKNNIIQNKNKLSTQTYDLLLNGNKQIKNNNKIITELDNRWCLKDIMKYHVEHTKKLTIKQYNEIINL